MKLVSSTLIQHADSNRYSEKKKQQQLQRWLCICSCTDAPRVLVYGQLLTTTATQVCPQTANGTVNNNNDSS